MNTSLVGWSFADMRLFAACGLILLLAQVLPPIGSASGAGKDAQGGGTGIRVQPALPMNGPEGGAERERSRGQRVRIVTRLLADFDLAKGVLTTYGYCSDVVRDGPGSYLLDGCIADDRHQVSIGVRGFEPITLDLKKEEILLDPLLISRSYEVPFPARWGTPATERVDVPGGPVGERAGRPIPLRQFGIKGCEAAVRASVADLAAGTLSFPEPPCRRIEVSVPAEFRSRSAAVDVEGCQPGIAGAVKPSAEGSMRCIARAADIAAGVLKLRLTWAGFEPVEVDARIGAAAAVLDIAEIAARLRPAIVRDDVAAGNRAMPAYRLTEMHYFVGRAGCGSPVRVAGASAPSLAEAGCWALPDHVDLTFEIDRAQQSVPPEAFRERVGTSVAIGSAIGVSTRLDPDRTRVRLPVEFSDARRERYLSEFAAELFVKGARVYETSECSRGAVGQSRVVPFANGGAREGFLWPVYGQVLDDDGRALTNCAMSIVEHGEDDHPYLTFELFGTRAAGPRRAVVLARSQELMDKPGLSKALETAINRFVRTASEWHQKGAALSPVDVLSATQDGRLTPVLSGEDAALDPQKALMSYATMDRTAPRTPDLSLLTLSPETQGADRVLVVMDGSSADAKQVTALRMFGADLSARKGGGSLQFILSSNSCELWKPHSAQLKCVSLETLRQPDQVTVLAEALTSFLNPVRVRPASTK